MKKLINLVVAAVLVILTLGTAWVVVRSAQTPAQATSVIETDKTISALP
ncbi:MAG: hypothetical protein OHK0039_09070 [Bacteroidia bacterium]